MIDFNLNPFIIKDVQKGFNPMLGDNVEELRQSLGQQKETLRRVGVSSHNLIALRTDAK